MIEPISTVLTITSLVTVKSYLASRHPNTSPSHRIEAFARACGFRSYASLRARIVEETLVSVSFVPAQIDAHLKCLAEARQADA